MLIKLYLYGIAALSIVDMLSDIVMIVRFRQSGDLMFANSSLACVSLNLLLQSIMTYLVNKKLGWWTQVKEQAIVFSVVKPAVETWRFLSKSDEAGTAVADNLFQLSSFRAIELVTEAIPSTLIQGLALLSKTGNGTTRSGIPILSLASSIIVSATISANISYDFDTSEKLRKIDPGFFGYLPSSKKRLIFILVLLFQIAVTNLAIRSLTFIILTQKPLILVILFGGEMVLYVLFKVLGKDFTMIARIEGRTGTFVASFIYIVITKQMVNWTRCVQFRRPVVHGGLSFSFTFLVTMGLGVIAMLNYDKNHGWLDKGQMSVLMLSCCAGLVVSLCLFLGSIERQYVQTFYNTRTGAKYIQDIFSNGKTDEQKFDVFTKNEGKWRAGEAMRSEVTSWEYDIYNRNEFP
ncbi:hypothetical protein TL16_g00994 [Triparma laevis f. inornata]|uniref:Uncharacterized protein n=1 Tax=Triparma laevis f. inornata TaxID=1714386 RepID=A0A9W6ZFL9_9STRA|nr:hypothetical protein TL16_g00994 [Triparma laevis f. inornata]